MKFSHKQLGIVSGVILLILLTAVFITGSKNITNDAHQIEPVDSTRPSDVTAPVPTPTTPGVVLNLSRQGLTEIPRYTLARSETEVLDLSHNNMTGALPSEIGKMVNLRVLNISHNKMTGVPAEVGHLKKLEVLDLSYNELTGLPYELGDLQNLQTLDLRGNNYAEQDLAIIRDKLPANTTILID